ncbi:MAG: hypothetical protein NT096_00315 [Proteobacteria bacterium]|nr:hypothetical protein [Pseudomonadota bacterium]
MSARTIGMYRKPVTLFLLKQVAADKADKKVEVGLVVESRAREIPTSYDDLHISSKQALREQAQGKVWLEWASKADSRQKINLLEHRRLARKTSIDRKSFQYDESNYDLCEACIG